MPHSFTEKNAPTVLVSTEGAAEIAGCVVDASFAQVHVRFEGPVLPTFAITDAVTLRFCSNGSIEGVEAPGRVIERREMDASRAYVIQVPPEISRKVLQADGLRNDFRLETARHPEAGARVRAPHQEWTPVILKNLSISGAAALLSPRDEAALAETVLIEIELRLSPEWVQVLPARIVQRRLEGPRTNCGIVFEWPIAKGAVELERQLRAWIHREQVQARADRKHSA